MCIWKYVCACTNDNISPKLFLPVQVFANSLCKYLLTLQILIEHFWISVPNNSTFNNNNDSNEIPWYLGMTIFQTMHRWLKYLQIKSEL